MNIIEDLQKVEAEHYVLSALAFLATFSPGLLALVIYFPDEFMEMGSLKLVLVSFAVSIPVSIPHLFGAFLLISISKYTFEQKVKLVPVIGTLLGASAAFIVSYVLIAIAFFSDMGLKHFVLLTLIVEVTAGYLWCRAYIKERARNSQGT